MLRNPTGTETPVRFFISAEMRRLRFSPPRRMPISMRFSLAPFDGALDGGRRKYDELLTERGRGGRLHGGVQPFRPIWILEEPGLLVRVGAGCGLPRGGIISRF